MKRLILFFFLLTFSFGFAQEIVVDSTGEAKYEHILNFHSDVIISKDAEVTVTEKIKVYAAGINIRRGIFRSLPRSREINGKTEKIKYDIISVKKDGQKEDYHTEKTGSDFAIYFGRKDVILTPGFYEYELTYKTTDQIGFFENYDEFYWNVNGTLWDYPVDQISVNVTLPENAKILQKSCYTGGYGGSESNCIGKELTANTIEWSARNLSQHEGLTIAVGFSKGVFTPPPPPGFLEKYGLLAGLLSAALCLLIYFYTTWQKYGVDPQKPVVYPQFSSPQNLSPASIGYLEKETYSGHLISAALVSLATKGFLKIIEDDKRILGIFGGKEYTLEKIKEQDQSLPPEEINLMNTLFPGHLMTVAFDGKYDAKIADAVTDFKASLSFQHDNFLKKGNNSTKLILPILIIGILYALGLYITFHFTDNEVFLSTGIPIAVGLFVAGVFISVFFERSVFVKILFGLLSILMIVILGIFTIKNKSPENFGFYASYGFLIFGFITMVLYQYLIKQPTPAKLETKSLIDGFKMYLGTAEEKTLQFHNSPKMSPEVFETMLPFAMVLGVDKIWGEKFQNMLKNASMGTDNYQSNWFVGSSIMNMNFANSLNSSLSQSIASSATQPSSSGSGSGGGGFSGGGGGGGGGGGW